MRVCTLILLLLIFSQYIYGQSTKPATPNPKGTTKSPKATVASPKITLLPGMELLPPYKAGNTTDNGVRGILVTLQLSNPAKADVKVQFALRSIHQLRPVLLDSVITIKKSEFTTGTHNIQVPLRLRLNPVDSLPGGDAFEMIKKGSTTNVYRLLVDKWSLLPPSAISLAVASDTVPVCLKSDKTDKGIRTVILSLNLSGQSADAAPSYDIDLSIPNYIQSSSKPKIISQLPIRIYKADLGTGASVQVPVVIQLTPVDPPTGDEVIPILIAGDNGKAHNLVIAAKKSQEGMAAGGGGVDASKPKGGKTKSLLHLDNNATVIHPVLKKDVDSTDHTRHDTYVDLMVLRDTMAVVDDTVNLAIDQFNFPYNPAIESQNPVYLHQNKWVRVDSVKNTKCYQKVQVILTNPPIDTLPDDEFANIRIEGGDETYHGLRLTQKGVYVPYKPFWIELGANFDVSSGGFTPSNMYAGIFLYKKDVAKWFNKKNNISFAGGAYLSKTSPSNIASDSGLVYRDGRSYINTGNGFRIFRDTGTVTASTTITDVGLFFSPQLRLTNGKADEPGWHVFIGVWAELLWQTVKTSYDYSKLGPAGVDSLAGYVPAIDSVNKFGSKMPTRNQDFRSHYLGVCVPVFLKVRAANLYINPVFWGLTTQQFVQLDHFDQFGNVLGRTSHTWNSFYLIQFRLNEEVYGFSFTGEIRGLYGGPSKPAVSLALSKKFDLDKIGEYVKSVLKF